MSVDAGKQREDVAKYFDVLFGTMEPIRVELAKSTGTPEIDRLLREALSRMPKPSELPPKDLPQPVVLRVTSS